jgi:rhamnosyltransferase subunit B
MPKIVLATMGSLGDLHPMIALGLELKTRGHSITVCTWNGYEEKVVANGFRFASLSPDIDPDDRELHKKAMDAVRGPEFVLRDLIIPNVGAMYDDLTVACDGADLLVSGEIVYAAATFAEVTGIKWVTTCLSPMTMFSTHDPGVPPQAPWVELFRPLPSFMHKFMLTVASRQFYDWLGPYRELRRLHGLSEDHDPILFDKFSPLLHLAMFSKAIARPQPDWHSPTLQTGFCFFDESGSAAIDPRLDQFLNAGDPPITFTLGSAAVMDAGDFFNESVEAAKRLGRRALMIYGRDCEKPVGLNRDIAAFEYVPYSHVFPRSACIVHQGGVGTTAQALKAGVPQLVMPYSHDQFDNAARCRREGVAEVTSRDGFTARNAAGAIENLLTTPTYFERARELKRIVDGESGTSMACDAIESVFQRVSA